MFKQNIGAVMVVGGGVAAIQASLDLADSGYKVYMVEKASSIGGVMAQLDKTFPTNDCSMCIISPKLVEAARHLNIKLFTLTELESVVGESGNYHVKLKQWPRFVDVNKCIACGICAEKCPKKVDDIYNCGLIKRKAIYLQYPQSVPLKYTIDENHCIYFKNGKCRACEKFCPSDAINFDDKVKEIVLNVGAVILAPGFDVFDPSVYDTYNYADYSNVVTSLEFERMLSASGPYGGHLVRPTDGKVPKNIAWLQCVGSRDINNCDNPYCSSVCCMYANKQAVVAKDHLGSKLGTTIFFIDMRTFGKDFDKYTDRARENFGVRQVRSRIHSVFSTKDDCLRIIYSTESGNNVEEIFDLVVLSVGLSSSKDATKLAEIFKFDIDEYKYALTSTLKPVNTTKSGIYVCGSFQEPKDIPFSVMEASASSAVVSELLADSRWTMTEDREMIPEIDVALKDPRVAVFVCNCGINIGGAADVPAIRDYAISLSGVVHVEDGLFVCSQDFQSKIKKIISEKNINRVVVASCSPRTHEILFQETMRDVGLNKYLFEMANIRDQNTWVHKGDFDKATKKAKDLVRMAVAKVILSEPLYQVELNVTKHALVIGGGIAGMEAALSIANQGCDVTLVEKSDKLGGIARSLRSTWKGDSISKYLKEIVKSVELHSRINICMKTEIVKTGGSVGNFTTTLVASDFSGDEIIVSHGVTIFATGGIEARIDEYLYGLNPNVLTHLEVDVAFSEGDLRLNNAQCVVFIQCVGSRNDKRPYCSKVCCTHTLKTAIALKKIDSTKKIVVIYRDIRSYGFREKLYYEAREYGILFIRYDLKNIPTVSETKSGDIYVSVYDLVIRNSVDLRADLLVLASGIMPNENKKLYDLFKIQINDDGFLVEAHAKLRPVDFSSDGIFFAGLAHYPKPVEETIIQAKAAASRAMTILSKNTIMVGGVVAEVDFGKCAACLTCVRVCPYFIPCVCEHNYAVIEESLCHGCGVCVAECPGKAITLRHFTDRQLIAKASLPFLS